MNKRDWEDQKGRNNIGILKAKYKMVSRRELLVMKNAADRLSKMETKVWVCNMEVVFYLDKSCLVRQ